MVKMRLTAATQVEYDADEPKPAPMGRVERVVKRKLGLMVMVSVGMRLILREV